MDDAHLSAGAKALLQAACTGLEKRAVSDPLGDGIPMNPDMRKLGEDFARVGAILARKQEDRILGALIDPAKIRTAMPAAEIAAQEIIAEAERVSREKENHE